MYYRILQFLRINRSVGVLSIVLHHMIVDVSKFMAILFVFSIGFSFAFACLFPNPDGYDESHLLGRHPGYEPWWGVVGSFSPTTLADNLNDRQPTTTIAPLMLYCYQFMVTIILINLRE